jgi:filamentous hemagglutinin family protein
MENSLKKSILLLLLTSPICLFSLGGKPEIVHGSAEYELSGATEVVRVSEKTILEYQKFNIGELETTRYEQPSSKSTLLCRVKGKDSSVIRGRLEANGKLLFINPNGIIFSESAHVNVGTLIASTLDIHNDHFLEGRYKFNLAPEAHDSAIVNRGVIEAAHNVVFMAPKIVDEGFISVKVGKIAYGGGESVTLDFDGDELIQFAIDKPLEKGFIELAGELSATQAYMRLPMAHHAIKSVLNVDGLVEAGRIEIDNGVIRLAPKSKINAKLLDMDGETLIVSAPVQVDKFTPRMTGEYILENSISVKNNALTFDAPVSVNAEAITISTGNGNITFLKGVEAKKPDSKLSLSSGGGDIDFREDVLAQRLDILSAHNVNAGSVNAGELTINNISGIATLAGPVRAASKAEFKGYKLNVGQSFTVDNGPMILDVSGRLQVSENGSLSASSITHQGTGDIFLGGKWTAHNGGIVLEGGVQLIGAVDMHALKGDILFNKGIDGSGELKAASQNFTVKGNIDRIAKLTVDADQDIRLSNVGKGDDGIEGILHLHTKGSVFFEGADYVATGHDYKSGKSFEFISGQITTVFAKTKDSVQFKNGPVNIAEDTTLIIRSNHGSVELPSVQGKEGSHLIISTPENRLKVGSVAGVEDLAFIADDMTFLNIDAGSILVESKTPVHISHPMTAHTGDFIVNADLIFDAPETELQALKGDTMRFNGTLAGKTKLKLNAPEGEISLMGKVVSSNRLGQLAIHGKKISQYESVIATGPVHYSGQIMLGHDIYSDNAITLDGPVMLFNRDAIHLHTNKFNTKPIELTSTLDADLPTRMLTLQNPMSLTKIKGAIGKNGPLGELIIKSKNVLLQDSIGGANPGIIDRFEITTSYGVECSGPVYHAGQQQWDAGKVHFTHEGPVEIITDGLPLAFINKTELELDRTESFKIQTNGGRLDLAKISCDYAQPITILAGQGEIHLNEIGKKATNLHVEGRDILLAGHVEAGNIFMEAENRIEYDQTLGIKIMSPALQSEGAITLNSKRSMIGSVEDPINIETKSDLFIGAKKIAYLKGTCADQNPHVYPPNPPPRTVFNGGEYNYVFIDDLFEDDPNLKTIAPGLAHKTPTTFMDGTEIKPRKAPIYYDTSKK